MATAEELLTKNEAKLCPYTTVKRLTPFNAEFFEGTFSLLHCKVLDDTLYRGVFAVLLFPITHPGKYISIRYTDIDDKVKEIGVIEDLSAFPKHQQDLIRKNLAKQYYEKVITHIYDIRHEFGLLFFEVETNQGRERFLMPWRYEKVEEYGSHGKVLIDAYGNRYIIPDVQALPNGDRQNFTRFIYW